MIRLPRSVPLLTLAFAIALGPASPKLLAAELPAEMLAAARTLPASSPLRHVCAPILGLSNSSGLPVRIGDTRVFARAPGYDRRTSGAYLGSIPADMTPTPFIQALLQAGVATELPVTWIQRTRVATITLPRLTDTGAAATSAAHRQPAFTEIQTSAAGHLFVVVGEAADLFGHGSTGLTPMPPAIELPVAQESTPPPDMWGSDSLCINYQAAQVLEYVPPRSTGNGTRTAAAYIKFDAERFPSWLADQRVIQALARPFRPFQIYAVIFRDDGDGWRADEKAAPLTLEPTVIVGP